MLSAAKHLSTDRRRRPRTHADAASPVSRSEFAALMDRCGPFEARPLLAVAVSGGADSMALALLADAWARTRRGRIVALTVDHRLRPDSGAEAAQVSRWLRGRGIAHRVLAWDEARPATGIQAAARIARYRLLEDWCRREGALHLLLGHNRDDQAETVLLRLAAGSGPHGLAAMPVVLETAAVRILRPLLTLPRARLVASLAAHGQAWIEDPSNRDVRFARVRVRRLLANTPGAEAVRERVAAAAAELGRFRAVQERAVAATLARAVELMAQGHARLDMGMLVAAPAGIGWRALAALLATIGGLDHAPPGDAVRGLLADAAARPRGRTLGRCRLVPEGKRWLVVREMRGLEAKPAPAAWPVEWDGRFEITAPRGAPLGIGALGPEGWGEIVRRAPRLGATALPYAARISLPALRDRRGVAVVPALEYARLGGRMKAAKAAFRPRRPLVPAFYAAEAAA